MTERIVCTDKAKERIDPEWLAQQLGAEPVPMAPANIEFTDHVETSAYAVVMCQILKGQGKDPQEYLDSIDCPEPGKWVIKMTKPLPEPVHLGILHGIRADQKKNPEKWEKARRGTQD
jgi:hypothetical protein